MHLCRIKISSRLGMGEISQLDKEYEILTHTWEMATQRAALPGKFHGQSLTGALWGRRAWI